MATVEFSQIELNFLDFHKGLLESGSPEIVWQVLNEDDHLPFRSMEKLFILWAYVSKHYIYYIKRNSQGFGTDLLFYSIPKTVPAYSMGTQLLSLVGPTPKDLTNGVKRFLDRYDLGELPNILDIFKEIDNG